ncbi:MAG: carboxypeptidase-like regulatory domain-containing protein [Acidobacteriota bacterium]|nr:carboxypeptidase-like regulatory domain-containing protein [Acidobacteriota bacterium]
MPTSHFGFDPDPSRLVLAFVLFAVVLLSPGTVTNAQSGASRARATSQTPAAGQSTVKGRVIYKDNAQPLKGVRVRIFTSNNDSDDTPGGGDVFAFTNDRGEFRVDNLGPGKYYVTLEGPGVAMPSGFGMKIPLPMSAIPKPEDFEEIVPKHDAEFTVDGTNTAEVEVRIARGGKISGKVMKANGEPVANVAVSFISREGSVSGPYTSRFTTQSDQNGEYRLDNVPAGDYIVAVATEDKRGLIDIRARLRGESQVTYHPAAITIRDAVAVRVDPGRETGSVNVTLVTRNSYVITGTVVRQQDGSPVVGATVLLRNKESEFGGSLVPGIGQRTTRSDAEGRWWFNNVMEGSYVLTALAPASRPARQPGEEAPDREQSYRESRQRFLVAQQDVDVAGSDLSGISMAISGPGSISGIVEVEGGGTLPPNLVIFLELIRRGNRPGPPLPVRVKPNGSFIIGGIQGSDVYLSAALPPDAKYSIKSVTSNGEDLLRSPLKVLEGAEAGPVKIVISPKVGSLAGRVLSERTNQGVSDFVVLLAPVESERQRFRTAYLTARTSADGTFSVTGAPGEYFVFARRREDLPPIVSEEFVRAESPKAQRVALAAGEQKQLELRVP